MNLISIKPGLVNCGTGIAVFQDGDLICTYCIKPKEGQDKLTQTIDLLMGVVKGVEDPVVVIEDTLISYKYFLGAVLYWIPDLKYLRALSINYYITGNQSASSKTIKEYVLRYVGNDVNFEHIANTDVLDAIAVGMAYMQKDREAKCDGSKGVKIEVNDESR